MKEKPQSLQRPLSPLRIAFDGWFKPIGIIISGVSILSFIVKLLELQLAYIFQRIIETYQSITYPLWQFLLQSINIPFHPIAADLLTFYCAMGGVAVRTFSSMNKMHWLSRKFNLDKAGLGFIFSLANRSKTAAGSLVFILWPFILWRLLSSGTFLYKHIGYENDPSRMAPTFGITPWKFVTLQIAFLALFVALSLALNTVFFSYETQR